MVGRALIACLSCLLWCHQASALDIGKGPPPEGGAHSSAGVVESLLAQINHRRTERSLAPLELDAAQSQIAALFAPHCWHASELGTDSCDSLGERLRRGRSVEGTVPHGYAGWMLFNSTPNARSMVTALLRNIEFHDALLDPIASRIALGTVESDGELGVLFGVYQTFESVSSERATDYVRARIAQARTAAGVGPLRRLVGGEEMLAEAVARLEAGDAAEEVREGLVRAIHSEYRLMLWTGYQPVQDLSRYAPAGWIRESEDLNLAFVVARHPQTDSDFDGDYIVLYLHGGHLAGQEDED